MLIDNLPKLCFFLGNGFFVAVVPSEGLLPFQKWVEINDDGRNGTFKAVKLTNYNQKSNLIFIQPWEIISTLVSNYNLEPTYI